MQARWIYTDEFLNLINYHLGSGIYIPDLNVEYYVSTTATSSMKTEILAIDLALQ